jgi:ABC-2 type transport system ATP-binding protein
MGALQLLDLSYTFGDRLALDRVSMDVSPGGITGLLGPNGAGKTTLMRLLLGVLPPGAGTMRYNGAPVDMTVRRRWGYMPQERGLYPAMPAAEQVVHFGRLHGLSRREATSRARALLNELGLEERGNERTDKLSGGMQQRLQLATALVHDPPVIVLDEPFAGLDPVAVEELSGVLGERASRGLVVLFSSHQLDLVQHLCGRIVMLDRGKVVLSGEVAALRASWGRRQCRIGLDTADRRWLDRLAVTVRSDRAGVLDLLVPPGTDPFAVLDAARAVSRVTEFGIDLPPLSQIFLDAVQGHATPSGVATTPITGDPVRMASEPRKRATA